jgi:hypothetical protein
MAEYIERGAAKKAFCEYCDWAEAGSEYCRSCSDPIGRIPAADVAPVRHGRWISEPGHIPHCSECGRYSDDADTGEAICCPFCGAKMGKDGDGE